MVFLMVHTDAQIVNVMHFQLRSFWMYVEGHNNLEEKLSHLIHKLEGDKVIRLEYQISCGVGQTQVISTFTSMFVQRYPDRISFLYYAASGRCTEFPVHINVNNLYYDILEDNWSCLCVLPSLVKVNIFDPDVRREVGINERIRRIQLLLMSTVEEKIELVF